ncbi:MAG: hypothetical protein KCHDKBKB_01435 [Elusimicrobia bacterium]|nr:hypothetical protein [Elusimicrobiota bacterium]
MVCYSPAPTMNFINRLERSIGWMAVGHLPIYIVTAQALLYVWSMMNPESSSLLLMDPLAVQEGEYWRLLTFLFIVPFQNVIFTFFYLYFQYLCGVALEEEWGSFPLTLFYLIGALGALAGSLLVGGNTNGAFYFNETIFLAFAALFPNFSLLLFFVLPIKIKWIAWFTWARILWGLYEVPILWKWAILISLANYFLFFSKAHFDQVRNRIRIYRHRKRLKDFES